MPRPDDLDRRVPVGPAPSRPWLLAATALGLAHAAVSLAWVLGSTVLLDTVGGQIEQWGRDGGPGLRLALAVVVAAKVAAVVVTWLAVEHGTRTLRRAGWTAALVLAGYGGVLTVVGVAYVSLGPVEDAADPYALRWHAFFWDPWFLLWGLCAIAALRISRPRPRG